MTPGAAAAPTLLSGDDDTIVARSSAEGRGALAIIRVSGARAIDIAGALGASGLVARRATRVRLVDDSGEPLDDAIATWFASPRSFTGEDVVEFTTHGGVVVPARVIAACVAAGAREARPGEFTWRAVRHGRLDLLQAEAVGDLIDARTTAMQQQALAQLDGGLSRRLLALRDELLTLEALLAYDVDFPEEDDGPVAPARIAAAAAAVADALRALLATAPRGAVRRDGVLVVIAGAPNAGKSSLFNALLGQSRAIVTPVAGTTRDAIEALLDRTPWPLRLVDTAGLRETADVVEQLGIEVSTRYLGEAAVVLACGETTEAVAETVRVVAPQTAGVVVPVRTKGDLDPSANGSEAIVVSAETGLGLEGLLTAVDRAADEAIGGKAVDTDAAVITRERHRAALSTALDEVEAFRAVWGSLPAPVAVSHLLTAREAMSNLLGVMDADEILGRVFSSFCIGK